MNFNGKIHNFSCSRQYSKESIKSLCTCTMEQCTLKNVNNGLNSDIYSYLETSGGKSYNPYLNFVHFFNTTNMV